MKDFNRFIGGTAGAVIEAKEAGNWEAKKFDGSTLNLSLLENIHEGESEDGIKIIARCPACALDERDSRGTHLVIYPCGAFSCAAHQGDAGVEHRKLIKKLIGLNDPKAAAAAKRVAYALRKKREEVAEAKEASEVAGKELWDAVKKTYSMTLGDFTSTSPSSIPEAFKDHFRTFCGLFQPDDSIWAGGLYDHELEFRSHLFCARDWEKQWNVIERDGCEFSNGHAFNYLATSRAKANYQTRRLFVVEHDKATIEEQIALLRFLMSQDMTLRGVVHTGGKGVHGLFDPPADAQTMTRLIQIIEAVGADLQSAKRSQTRTPGAMRSNGNLQLFVWINNEEGK
jgi:hypothetical protein